MPLWIPRIGWNDLDAEDAYVLGLNLNSRWQVLVAEWFGHGIVIGARPKILSR